MAHTPAALTEAVERAITAYAEQARWVARMQAAMRKDFGWAQSATIYREVYRRAAVMSP